MTKRWKPVQVQITLIEKINLYYEHLGYYSVSEYVNAAVREKLRNDGVIQIK